MTDSSWPSQQLADPTSTVTDTEEGRAFFQARQSIFAFCLFALAGGSWLLLSIASVLGGFDHRELFSIGSALHLGNALLVGALWLVTRRGRLRGRVLHALDIGVSIALIAIWGLAGAIMPDPMVGRFIGLLSFIVGFLARAIVVPSTARRTLGIGLIGVVIIVAFAVHRGEPGVVLGSSIATACWAASAVTIGTLASHTIFGLRREAQKARVLGQYTLEAKIGEGGMGVVWRASHALLRRPTAIKLLPPGRTGDAAVRRFEREVQITARLTHPNTVAIYDYGRTRDGIFYYAMELLDGTDLERLVKAAGPLPPERVAHLLIQVAGALAEAHDLGLVHRDVKPANIFLSPRLHEHEFVKIVDFGLVKQIETTASDPGATANDVITGTPLYLSPEAIETPDAVDGRSDLYALGAVAWFLLVGRPVFEGPTLVSVCSQHLHAEPPRPSAVLGRPLPFELEELVLGCLEKRPERRPADARVLRSRLEATALAASWTAERAAAWWQQHQADLAGVLSSSPGTGPRTIALDVTERSLSAWREV
jgi:serine/threonine protein kinase